MISYGFVKFYGFDRTKIHNLTAVISTLLLLTVAVVGGAHILIDWFTTPLSSCSLLLDGEETRSWGPGLVEVWHRCVPTRYVHKFNNKEPIERRTTKCNFEQPGNMTLAWLNNKRGVVVLATLFCSKIHVFSKPFTWEEVSDLAKWSTAGRLYLQT